MNSHIICGAIDDLYQKNAHFSKLKLFFSMRCIRLSTVLSLPIIASFIIQQANDNDDYFPVWGTCLGFQLLAFIVAGNDNSVLSATDATNLSLPLEFIEGVWFSLSPSLSLSLPSLSLSLSLNFSSLSLPQKVPLQ